MTQLRYRSGLNRPSAHWIARLAQFFLLFLPGFLLLIISFRVDNLHARLLWLGAAFQGLGALLALWTWHGGREPLGPAAIMLYVIALGWLMFGMSAHGPDWLVFVTQAILLVVPVGLFGNQCLRDSGATAMRRARHYASCLRARRTWPRDLSMCRELPEVKALRESLHIDASPALELLACPLPAVRIAALAALEYRPTWRPGQPQVVLQLARRAPEPEVRAAAVNALANLEDRSLVESLCELLHDQSALVRATVAEAILWNCEQRWGWVRHHLHRALTDPALQDDGALKFTDQTVPREVLEDWRSWCSEKGCVGMRAALTLGAYYSRQLTAGASAELVIQLRKDLIAPQTPAMLRLELARLLQQAHELTTEDLYLLLNPTMAAPVRLIAAEALLALGDCPEAVATLHDLARLPNREIALATAQVVQTRLGVDMGLSRGEDLPAVGSRAAAEVARRVLIWANRHELGEPHHHPHSSRVPL